MRTRRPLTRAAIALASACALQPCLAQSSVTVYGVIDAMAGRYTGAPAGVNAADRAVYRQEGGGMSTSHLGFRGSEDLGGGFNAVFELAHFFRNDTGEAGRNNAIGAPVNVAADPFWSRSAWVGLSHRDYGRMRLGNGISPTFFASITSNAFGDSTVFSPLNLVTFIGSPLSGGTGWTNQVMVDSPNLAGFSAHAAVSLAETQGGRNLGLRLNYAKGPLAASVAVQNVKKNPLTFADGTSANNTRAWLLAGSYDFSSVKVFAHLAQIDNRGTETAPLDLRYRIWELSASVPVGSGRLLAGVASRKTGDTPPPVPATAAGGNRERRVITLGYDHDLSKRTDLYVMLMSDRTVTRTLPAPPALVTATATQFGVGIRHRF